MQGALFLKKDRGFRVGGGPPFCLCERKTSSEEGEVERAGEKVGQRRVGKNTKTSWGCEHLGPEVLSRSQD